jgi:hypothetical protein
VFPTRYGVPHIPVGRTPHLQLFPAVVFHYVPMPLPQTSCAKFGLGSQRNILLRGKKGRSTDAFQSRI